MSVLVLLITIFALALAAKDEPVPIMRPTIEICNEHNAAIEVMWQAGDGRQASMGPIAAFKSHGFSASAGDTFVARDKKTGEVLDEYHVTEEDAMGTVWRVIKRLEQCGLHDDRFEGHGVTLAPPQTGDYFIGDFLNRARTAANARARQANECVRLKNMQEQPRRVPHFTPVGYKHSRMPPEIWKPLKAFYERNKASVIPEVWPLDGSYVNFWETPTAMMPVPFNLKQVLFHHFNRLLTEWAAEYNHTLDLEPKSCYGIRFYYRNNFLRNHVDVISTHVLSAIMQVDQATEEAWPLEVIGHDGVPRHIKMKPGDMVFYESASVIHGRPSRLRGSYYANVFIHFKPVGTDENGKPQWDFAYNY